MPEEGVEPSHPEGRGILSPLRLPFRHSGELPGRKGILAATSCLSSCSVWATMPQRSGTRHLTLLHWRDVSNVKPDLMEACGLAVGWKVWS